MLLDQLTANCLAAKPCPARPPPPTASSTNAKN